MLVYTSFKWITVDAWVASSKIVKTFQNLNNNIYLIISLILTLVHEKSISVVQDDKLLEDCVTITIVKRKYYYFN